MDTANRELIYNIMKQYITAIDTNLQKIGVYNDKIIYIDAGISALIIANIPNTNLIFANTIECMLQNIEDTNWKIYDELMYYYNYYINISKNEPLYTNDSISDNEIFTGLVKAKKNEGLSWYKCQNEGKYFFLPIFQGIIKTVKKDKVKLNIFSDTVNNSYIVKYTIIRNAQLSYDIYMRLLYF